MVAKLRTNNRSVVILRSKLSISLGAGGET
jgi:hypothetical protein